jgi:hypothetical protein
MHLLSSLISLCLVFRITPVERIGDGNDLLVVVETVSRGHDMVMAVREYVRMW